MAGPGSKQATSLGAMRLELTSGTVANDGEDIYWELVTEGADDERPVVALSHGAGGTHAIWYQQVPALGAHFRVVTWDSRGFGNSTNRADRPSPEAAADDLAAVLDAAGVDRAHLVGQSMGGWHISAFAVANPDRVRSLVYADTVGGLWTDLLREAFDRYTSERGGVLAGAADVVGRHPAIWSGTGERDRAKAFLYQAMGSLHRPPMHRLAQTLDWSVSHDAIAALGVPTLFVAGVHDEIFVPDLLAESSRRIPGAIYVEIAEAGHSPYFERPDAWNDVVLEFLRSA